MIGRDVTNIVCLVIKGPDRTGLVAEVSTWIAQQGGTIINAAQFSSPLDDGMFFLRAESRFHNADAALLELLRERFAPLARDEQLQWRMSLLSERKKVALFVSREEHCLLDLLWRVRHEDLHMQVVAVISNHPDLRGEVEAFGVPYVHIPVTRATKSVAEQRQLEVVAGKVDLVVLARYMQILSDEFLRRVGCPVINIHHSFLPAFIGAGPYEQAYRRGVKLIGATAHYATAELDEGPIIEQETSRVGHQHDPRYLAYIGRDLERIVLARAVNWHLQDRVIEHDGRTIVLH